LVVDKLCVELRTLQLLLSDKENPLRRGRFNRPFSDLPQFVSQAGDPLFQIRYPLLHIVTRNKPIEHRPPQGIRNEGCGLDEP
jgi:hypothetical protein